MKVLLFSDLHLDAPFQWAPGNLARTRRRALRETLRRICGLAAAEKVDAILCAGDLYEHERFSPDTAAFLRDVFASCDVPVYIAPGNHDWYGPTSLYAQVAWSGNVHLFTETTLTPVPLTDGLTLWGAAHCAPANTDGFLEAFTLDRGGVNLALFHGSERGELTWQESGKAPHAPFSAAQVERSGLAHAFCGHFHTPHDGPWHTYPGNPDPLTFGETGDRAAVLVEIHDDGTITRTRHKVAVSDVHDVTVTLAGARHAGEVVDQVAAAVADLTGVVRVTVSGEVAPEADVRLADLTGIAPHLDALVPRLGSISVTYDLDALAAEQTVRGQFVRTVQADPTIDDDTRRRVLITGLRALDGRGDELEVH